MEILNFGPSGSSPKKRRNRVALVVGAIALAAIGSTFAANISLNGGQSIQYGQGLQQAVACDSSITLLPANTFANASGNGAFNISSVAIYDTNTISSSTGLGNCLGKSLKISAFDATNNTPLMQCTLPLTSTTYSSGFSSLGTPTCTYNAGSTTPTLTNLATGGSVSNDGFTLTFTGTLSVAASSISKFTLESF